MSKKEQGVSQSGKKIIISYTQTERWSHYVKTTKPVSSLTGEGGIYTILLSPHCDKLILIFTFLFT